MSQSTGTLAFRQVRAVCTQRDPIGRATIVIVAEREERRQEREERRERERRKRDREKGSRERREPSPPPFPPPHVWVENVSVCTFKTLPSVLAKRPHVFNIRAFCQHTRKRFERTHGDVFQLTHGGFSACQATPNSDTTHTTTPKHKTHIHRTHTAPQSNRPWILHLTKICNVCNVCNFMCFFGISKER